MWSYVSSSGFVRVCCGAVWTWLDPGGQEYFRLVGGFGGRILERRLSSFWVLCGLYGRCCLVFVRCGSSVSGVVPCGCSLTYGGQGVFRRVGGFGERIFESEG